MLKLRKITKFFIFGRKLEKKLNNKNKTIKTLKCLIMLKCLIIYLNGIMEINVSKLKNKLLKILDKINNLKK